MTQKLFRDPLYDYIQIDDSNKWLLDLIATPEFQRLRFISQLGLSSFTYPGSTHTRFVHSLGVMHLMQECVRHLKQNHSGQFDDLDERALLAAALLHDIGHSPFSHATEEFFGNHEERGVAIITDKKSDVNKILKKQSKQLPAQVASLIAKKPVGQRGVKLWQKSLISSQLDMDRLDYLKRDSLYSGAEYGNFDCYRIIHTMELRTKTIKGKQKDIFIVWPNKSKYALEEYIFSRFYMYQSVYFHHTTRGFECLLRQILQCAKDLAEKSKTFKNQLFPPVKFNVQEFPDTPWQLNDHVLLAQIVIWQKSDHSTLSDLCTKLLHRETLAWEELPGTGMEFVNQVNEVIDFLKSKNVEHKYYFFEDNPQTSIYKPYSSASSPEELSSVTSIVLYDQKWHPSGFREITEIPGLERLKYITDGQSPVKRYYFPRKYEKQIRQILTKQKS